MNPRGKALSRHARSPGWNPYGHRKFKYKENCKIEWKNGESYKDVLST